MAAWIVNATNVNSAQLPNPIGLETIVRNRQVNDHGALVAAFTQTAAIDQLMTLKQAYAGADRVLQAAKAIENETTLMAPGTAAYATAAASIAAVQSQAHLQKMIAGQLRQEAARLAHETMALKRAAVFTRESRTKAAEMNR
jgi:hypothetical protein